MPVIVKVQKTFWVLSVGFWVKNGTCHVDIWGVNIQE